jgi:anti-sigma factor RsiW
MNIDHHERFQHMIDESLAGAISPQKEQSLREHLATCVPCQEYLNASNRVIAGLSGFSFEVNPTLNERVMEALTLQAQQVRAARRGGWRWIGLRNVSLRVWAAFAVALSMSIAGSAFVYQAASTLTMPMHVDAAQIQVGVLVFWLLPSFCSALCLLAVRDKNRGVA